MKKGLIIPAILTLIWFSYSFVSANKGKDEKKVKIRTIVLDAGHGGKDPGTLGKNSYEKDVALPITLELGRLIESNLPDVKVIYTRKEDVFVPLIDRANIANNAGADLFISIHCNANANASAFGFETFVMGNGSEKANLDVAKRENSAILKEENHSANYDGFDPNSPQSHIIFSMFQNAFLDQSIMLAANVQQHFAKYLDSKDRGVKEAGFLVLYKTYMPSVLIETGFLSNLKEEKALKDPSSQKTYSSAIFEGFLAYKDQVEVEIPTDKVIDKTGVKFRVQIGSSSEDFDIKSGPYVALTNLEKMRVSNLYKCYYGNYNSLNLAVVAQNIAREKGFPGAFVVAFNNNKIISIQEAKAILDKGK